MLVCCGIEREREGVRLSYISTNESVIAASGMCRTVKLKLSRPPKEGWTIHLLAEPQHLLTAFTRREKREAQATV